jgi:ADP-ribose pyrophosphatase YjhB (NUDIX family)
VNIYLGDKYLAFVPAGTVIPRIDSTLYFSYCNPQTVQSAYEGLEKDPGLQHVIIACDDVQKAFDDFARGFTFVEAAGGLVKNGNGEILFILRHNKWDLPKGKLEKNEKIEDCAVREVQEECGINEINITKMLSSTYHIYTQGDKKILKRTHWYEMNYPGSAAPQPQTSEGIQEVKWMTVPGAKEAMGNAYASVRELLSGYLG